MSRQKSVGSWFGLVVAVVGAAVLAMAVPAAGQGLEELRSRYPDVKWYDPHGRVLTVWGTPMTQGETPREAADEWVFWHGDVFGSMLDLEETRDVTLRRAPEGKERWVFMYRQTVDELLVVGSSFRVMTEGRPDSGPAAVVYVAGRVAMRPAGGLPAPQVTPAEALAAAKAHERGQGLEVWGDPKLVAIYDDAPSGDGVAYPVWRITGSGEHPDSYEFYIDAATGVVARYHSSIAHFADEIQGTVTGNATPAEHPTDLGPDTFAATVASCPNDADEFDLSDARVAAYLEGTETLVDSGFTDENGDYSLDAIPTTDVDIFAELKGPAWVVLDGTSSPSSRWESDPAAPLPHSGNPITSPATGVGMLFNPTPTEKWTAFVNAHRTMSKTWRWLDPGNLVPLVPLVVHDGVLSCNAWFYPPGATDPWPNGGLLFHQSTSACANSAYSTLIAHEYGHFVAHHLMGIEYSTSTAPFHEGFGDTLAVLVFGTEIMGQDIDGCGEHVRWPRQSGVTQAFPKCLKQPASGPQDCSMGGIFGAHCKGELLAALWLDMRDEFDDDELTREVFLDWMMIAQPAGEAFCPVVSANIVQAVDEGMLVEVLQVAAGSQAAAICQIFDDRNIKPPYPNLCPDSAGQSCYADCDGSAVLEFWDFLCFQEALVADDPYADCDGDGELTFFDILCFQNAFARGCP